MNQLTKRFLLSALLIIAITGVASGKAQSLDPYNNPPQTRVCLFREGHYVCGSATRQNPMGVPLYSLDSPARERAAVLRRQEQEEDKPYWLPVVQRYRSDPKANPDTHDQSELLKNAKDID